MYHADFFYTLYGTTVGKPIAYCELALSPAVYCGESGHEHRVELTCRPAGGEGQVPLPVSWLNRVNPSDSLGHLLLLPEMPVILSIARERAFLEYEPAGELTLHLQGEDLVFSGNGAQQITGDARRREGGWQSGASVGFSLSPTLLREEESWLPGHLAACVELGGVLVHQVSGDPLTKLQIIRREQAAPGSLRYEEGFYRGKAEEFLYTRSFGDLDGLLREQSVSLGGWRLDYLARSQQEP